MITARILDTALGKPAAGVPVQMDVFITGQGWKQVGQNVTDSRGSAAALGGPAGTGIYRLMIDVASYSPEAFFPSIVIPFEVVDAAAAYNLLVLVGPLGYAVQRESAE